MKLRQGFVSNSSTTSFCIYGTYFSEDERKTLQTKFNNDIEGIFKGTVLEVYFAGEYDPGVYVGMSWTRVGDDQTGKQFRQSVEDALKAVLGDSTLIIPCSTYEEAWYNG